MSNLADMLTDTVAAHAGRTALDDIELSYVALDGASARVAGLLAAKGVGPGVRVGVMLPNVPYFPFVFYGVLRLGGVVVPMNPLLKTREVGFHLTDSGSNLRAATQVSVDLVDAQHDGVTLGALPLFHVFGSTSGLNSSVRVGGCLTLLPRFDAGKALEIIQRDRVTTFLGVPTMYAAMLNHPDASSFDTSSLELCVSGGAAMPVEVLRAFEQTFACKVLEGYGLSETCAIASFNRPDMERKPGSIGVPVGGVEMRLIDGEGAEVAQGEVGEIEVRGPVVMSGYWNREKATAETIDADGWLRTGDLAKTDEDGYYFIVDRKKEMIIRGGFNVYPREIEEVLYEHPAVREAAVVGLPHAELGEEVGAAVALKEGAEASADEVQRFVKERVAAYKYPRAVWFVDELPKGPTGKILKREIKSPGETKPT